MSTKCVQSAGCLRKTVSTVVLSVGASGAITVPEYEAHLQSVTRTAAGEYTVVLHRVCEIQFVKVSVAVASGELSWGNWLGTSTISRSTTTFQFETLTASVGVDADTAVVDLPSGSLIQLEITAVER